jgi:Zn-dependent protease with chaperone function
MNFFQAQERARVTSRWLIVWFSLALIGVVASLYAVAVIAKSWFVSGNTGGYASPPASGWLDAELASYIGPLAGGLIILGSLYKLSQLSGGGSVVARDLGGRAVDPSTTDLLERRLINVVEEMAIASGIPAPETWILDGEEGINAFAAGTDPANAVIGITRGCLERLSRDELQGVVAHEFSHILNGDMKLNMRLTGWIFGLVMIAMLGRILLHALRHVRISSSRDSKGGGVIILIAAAGAAVWLIGSIGTLFARLMQAAISRQREYLADASAVQFTRNPSGIADALKKIGGFSKHGTIQSSGASEARHLFFASSDFLRLGFATHPPLEKRIRALEPKWDGQLLEAGRQVPPPRPQQAAVSGLTGAPMAQLAPATASFALDSLAESGRLDPQVGSVIRRDLQRANVAFHSKDEAKTLLYGLLLAQDGDGHERALALLAESTDPETAAAANRWHRQLAGRPAAEKLALVDLSLPWLRRMNHSEARAFLRLNRALIEADGEICLFEFMLERVLERHVAVGLGLRPVARMQFRSLAELRQETAILLGAFAGQSGDPGSLDAAALEFQQHTGSELPRLEPSACMLDRVAEALGRFEMSTPLVKSRILRLCGLVAISDGVLKDGEVELLRAAADSMGAPVPPLSAIPENYH